MGSSLREHLPQGLFCEMAFFSMTNEDEKDKTVYDGFGKGSCMILIYLIIHLKQYFLVRS